MGSRVVLVEYTKSAIAMTDIFHSDIGRVTKADGEYHIIYPDISPDPVLVTSDKEEAIRSAGDTLLHRYLLRQLKEEDV